MKVLAHLSILAIAISAAATSSADGFTVSGAKKMTVTASKLASAKKKATVGSIGLDKKSLTFNGSSIQLVVETGQGLRNPSLMVKAGATLHILFVNTDDDMFHSLRFTTKRAPFDAKIGSKGSVGSSDLAHMSTKSFFGQEFTLKVPMKKGMYRYVCTTAGHAAAGMYGTITVR
jgi:plastocyanin